MVSRYSQEIFDYDQQVRSMDCHILRHENARVTLTLWSGETTAALERYSSVLAPIRRIPRDILHEIFYHTIGTSSNFFNIREPPWVLSYVCGSWRDVILSSAWLWPRVISNASLPKHSLEMLDVYLDRSRNCPLDILFECNDSLSISEQVLEMLIDHSPRWRRVWIKAPHHFMDRLDLTIVRIPILEEVDIDFYFCLIDRYVAAFSDAPRLKSVTASIGLHSSRFDPRITRYKGNYNVEDDLNQLADYPSLVDCTLNFAEIYWEWMIHSAIFKFPNTPVYHSSIRFLSVDAVDMLAHLTLPGLEVLYIGDRCLLLASLQKPRPPPEERVRIITDFFTRSRWKLKSLTLMDLELIGKYTFMAGILKRFFTTLTFLQVQLNVYARESWGGIWELMDTSYPLIRTLTKSRLQHIIIYSENGLNRFAPQALLEMVESRMRSPHPLRRLDFIAKWTIDSTWDLETRFKSFAEKYDGLELNAKIGYQAWCPDCYEQAEEHCTTVLQLFPRGGNQTEMKSVFSRENPVSDLTETVYGNFFSAVVYASLGDFGRENENRRTPKMTALARLRYLLFF
ncbi:uncharacterized protein EV420DRAFT_1664164 [Desarmillaria tabescens]|uniref:F-box domain-containing protein n=1 Tax=Armillaria tabescens TaxID=1929756 RepID=A0AA39TUC7_ARMTA|nr:uncharacterized protein EV420DRAFT_1664164 [Desarmillaria tabescens]KAK0470412.1 hypothetical protein EV420DRAFT_1664164 [Desarmillaria tabescens]